jgi:taurine dioxygenase
MPNTRTNVICGRVDKLQIVPFEGALGAEIKGLSLREMDDNTFRVLHHAYLDHLMLLIRDQELTDADLVALARRFGSIEMPPRAEERAQSHRSDGVPEITVVSNVKVDGTPVGELGDGEVDWHSDFSFREVIASMRVLYAIELPPSGQGANTEFANTYAAWDMMPAQLRERVIERTIKHDIAYDTNRNVRRGAVASEDVREGKGPNHPIVSCHPETGCNSLFLGRRYRHYVNGCSIEESEALLDELWVHETQLGLRIVHEWHLGDVVLWDNRCTVHRRGAFNPSGRRVLHAAQVKGHKPFKASDAIARPPHPRYRSSIKH